MGCICSFEHGFIAKKATELITTFTHYEKLTGGVLGCLPASIGKGIVKKNYDDFNAILKDAREA